MAKVQILPESVLGHIRGSKACGAAASRSKIQIREGSCGFILEVSLPPNLH